MRKTTLSKLSSLLIVTLFCSTILLHSTNAGEVVQDLTVKVENAESVTTVTSTTSTQLRIEGMDVGEPVVTQQDPVEQPPQPGKLIVVQYEGDLAKAFLKVRSETTNPKMIKKGVYLVTDPGTHKIKVDLLDVATGNWPDITFTVTVEGEEEPEPEDDPVTPDEDDAQPVSDGPRVLVVYEATERTKLPKGQLEILSSKPLRDYLDSVCASRNGVPEYRFLDKDVEFTTSGQETFINLMGRDRKQLPWIVIAGPIEPVYEGPLPATVAELRALVDKYVPKKQVSPALSDKDVPKQNPPVQAKQAEAVRPVEASTPVAPATPQAQWRPQIQPQYELRQVEETVCDGGTCRVIQVWRRVRVR